MSWRLLWWWCCPFGCHHRLFLFDVLAGLVEVVIANVIFVVVVVVTILAAAAADSAHVRRCLGLRARTYYYQR